MQHLRLKRPDTQSRPPRGLRRKPRRSPSRQAKARRKGLAAAGGAPRTAPGLEACACAAAVRSVRTVTGSEGNAARIPAAKSACRK